MNTNKLIARVDEMLQRHRREQDISILGQRAEPSQKISRIIPYGPTYKDMLTREILIDKITPWAEELRKRLFNSTSPPFNNNWDDAIKWIENERGSPAPTDLFPQVEKLSKSLPPGMHLNLERRVLPYAKKGDEWISTLPVRGPLMAALENETRLIANATGFGQASLVMFVLTGTTRFGLRVKTIYSESTHTLPNNDVLWKKEINVVFRASDFTLRELQRIYAGIRADLRLKKGRPIKEKHLRVYKLVRELGPPPGRQMPGHCKYWKNASKKWNQKYKNDTPRQWQGLRGLYERIDLAALA